jgi:hypothetical protein
MRMNVLVVQEREELMGAKVQLQVRLNDTLQEQRALQSQLSNLKVLSSSASWCSLSCAFMNMHEFIFDPTHGIAMSYCSNSV